MEIDVKWTLKIVFLGEVKPVQCSLVFNINECNLSNRYLTWKTPYIGKAQIIKVLLSLTILPGVWTFFSKTHNFPSVHAREKARKGPLSSPVRDAPFSVVNRILEGRNISEGRISKCLAQE